MSNSNLSRETIIHQELINAGSTDITEDDIITLLPVFDMRDIYLRLAVRTVIRHLQLKVY